MKKVAKTIILAISTLGMAVAATGVMAGPYQHLRHIDHRENQVIRHGSHAIKRAYNKGQYHRAHRLTRQMNQRVSRLDHKRNRVINHRF